MHAFILSWCLSINHRLQEKMMLLFCLLAVLLIGIGRGQEPTNLPNDHGEGYYIIVRL